MPTLVQPFPMRSTVSDHEGRLRISIPLRQLGAAALVGCWLIGWTYGGLAILKQLLAKPNLFEALWICFWTASIPFAVYALLRMLGGNDVVLVDQHRFIIRRENFGVGFGKEYLTSEMRDLRFQPEIGSGRRRRNSRIAFDYGAKTFSFGERLDEAEANQLIALIKQRCSIAQTPPSDGSTPHFWQGGR
jgi:hypothetical protein